MNRLKTLLLAFLFFCLTAPLIGDSEEEDVLLRALKDEMARSLDELQLEDEPKPYFVSYTIKEVDTVTAVYVLGAHNLSSSSKSRSLGVNIRIGSPELDNTNSGSGSLMGLGDMVVGVSDFPLTDDYEELRREIWLATDRAYKQAVSDLTSKRAAVEGQANPDRPNDFSVEESYEYEALNEYPVSEMDVVSRIADQLSDSLNGYAEISSSSGSVTSISAKRLYIDSEGSFHRYETGSCTAIAQAKTQTADGTGLSNSTSAHALRCTDLPDIESLKADVVAMAEGLIAKRSAETLDRYNGPVLFEGHAAGELIGQTLVSRLGAVPEPVGDDSGFGALLGSGTNPFVDRLNARVLPSFLSVVNDPTITEFQGNSLLGSYIVDFEGMPSRRTELISNGVLKALLTTRAPTKQFDNTTGSNRGQPSPSPGSLFVETSEGVTLDELRSELFAIAEDNGLEFAVVIRRIKSLGDIQLTDATEIMQLAMGMMGGGAALMPAVEVVKVYPDGREVPVLPMTISNFGDRTYRDIVAVSEERWQHDMYLIATGGISGMMGAMSGGANDVGQISAMTQDFVSIVTPALVFEDLTLTTPDGAKPALPLIPHPLAEGQ